MKKYLLPLLFILIFATDGICADPVYYSWKPASPPAIGDTSPNKARFGQPSNYVDIDTGGVITYAGTAKRKLTMRPAVNHGAIAKNLFVPAQVNLGAFQCFSMPVYSSDFQELYFRERVPYRWDGSSNINFKMLVALNSAVTANKKFKFEFSWNKASVNTDTVKEATVNTYKEVTVVDASKNQYTTMSIPFTITYTDASSNIAPRDMLAGRIRRVANSGGAGTEAEGNILICDWVTEYQVDKLFGVW